VVEPGGSSQLIMHHRGPLMSSRSSAGSRVRVSIAVTAGLPWGLLLLLLLIHECLGLRLLVLVHILLQGGASGTHHGDGC